MLEGVNWEKLTSDKKMTACKQYVAVFTAPKREREKTDRCKAELFFVVQNAEAISAFKLRMKKGKREAQWSTKSH